MNKQLTGGRPIAGQSVEPASAWQCAANARDLRGSTGCASKRLPRIGWGDQRSEERLIRKLSTQAELKEALRQTAVFYKHSSRCWMSARALSQLERYAEDPAAKPVFLIDVLAHRELSNRLAAISGVRHASPQVILMEEGQARWHASHLGVSAKALLAAADG